MRKDTTVVVSAVMHMFTVISQLKFGIKLVTDGLKKERNEKLHDRMHCNDKT